MIAAKLALYPLEVACPETDRKQTGQKMRIVWNDINVTERKNVRVAADAFCSNKVNTPLSNLKTTRDATADLKHFVLNLTPPSSTSDFLLSASYCKSCIPS